MHRTTMFKLPEGAGQDIDVIKVCDNELTDQEINKWLGRLREHSGNDLEGRSYGRGSHFSVAALVKAKIGNKVVYAGGPNVENADHNELGVHAEQNAVSILQTFFPGAIVNELFLMAVIAQ